MKPVLFDSAIYITALRIGNQAALALRRFAANSRAKLIAELNRPTAELKP